jgi:hypothetical protein
MPCVAGPLPSIEGISNIDTQNEDHIPRPQLPPFTPIIRDQLWNLFLAYGPVNGLLDGQIFVFH